MAQIRICTNCESGMAHLHPSDFFCIRSHCNCQICRATKLLNMSLDKKIQKVLDTDVNVLLNKPIKFIQKKDPSAKEDKQS